MSNPKGLKRTSFSPNGPKTPKIRDMNLCILPITYMNIFVFVVLDFKLWLEITEITTYTLITLYLHSHSFNRKFKIDTKCNLLTITLNGNKATLNPIAYGILRLSQLRGGGGEIFIPHPRKQC